MSKIAIIGDGFSALFTAFELAKKNEEILVISIQKDEFESGILTPLTPQRSQKMERYLAHFWG